MKKILTVIAAAIIAFSSSANATGTLVYRGSIDDRCSLSGFVDGNIVVNVNGNVFSSNDFGGSAARVNVQTSSGNFRIVFGTPTLIGPSGAVTGLSFTLASMATGTNNGGQPITPSMSMTNTLQLSAPGEYVVTVNATATSTQTFATGNYTLQVPVSCTK